MRWLMLLLIVYFSASCKTNPPPDNSWYDVELDNNSIEYFESRQICVIDHAQLKDPMKFYKLFTHLSKHPPELGDGSSYYRISLQNEEEEYGSVVIDLGTYDKKGSALLMMIDEVCK